MKFMLLIYNDKALHEAMPATEFDLKMHDCIEHADELRNDGYLLDSQQLEEPASAKSLRIRKGRQIITDGPFSESKEVLGGFNLIEAENIEEALRIAAEFPWAQTGCVEVRPVRDLEMVRQRVSGAKATAAR